MPKRKFFHHWSDKKGSFQIRAGRLTLSRAKGWSWNIQYWTSRSDAS